MLPTFLTGGGYAGSSEAYLKSKILEPSRTAIM